MTESRLEKRILYIIVFILIGILLTLIFVAQVSIIDFKIGNKMLNFFSALFNKLSLSLVIGIAAVIYAKRALDYSKRSSLVKDSYGPLLAELKANYNLTLVTAGNLDFKIIKSIRESYLFDSLERKDRKYIESIIKKEKNINQYRKTVIPKAQSVVTKHLRKSLGNSDDEGLKIIGLTINQGEYKYKNSIYFFEKLLSNDLFFGIVSSPGTVWIDLGERDVIVNEYGIDKVITRPKKGQELVNYLETNLEIRLYDYGEFGEAYINPELIKLENTMLMEIRNENSYKALEAEYEELKVVINKFYNVINKRIKKLLIPNFWMNELSEGIHKWRERFK